ncbi:MAG TPA: SRPBCC domain-containing protein [Polyangiaceae bacterium]|nr:SRPBCC domain-containing protein [Polyangiaceae bacterium]
MDDLIKTITVDAPPSTVYRAWTTTEGLRSFMAPSSRIDLREGGDFEILFDLAQPPGLQGSEGCVVVSFEEDRALAFTWNFPPSLASIRRQYTIVRLTFDADAAGTRVTLRQSGWRDDGEWPAGWAYFDRAWTHVLGQLASQLTDP